MVRKSFTDRVREMCSEFKHIENDDLKASPGDVWSIKKFLVLDYYMKPFINIVRSRFSSVYYVDPFCGSGTIDVSNRLNSKNRTFPGSALIGASRASSFGYTDCILSDKNEATVNALNTRLKRSGGKLSKYRAKTMSFENALKKILELNKEGVAILILIDPVGYVPIKWKQMMKLYELGGIDIIFNFDTKSIARNAKQGDKKDGKNLTEFFGDEKWKKIINESKSNLGKNLLKYYKEKIEENTIKKVNQLPVYEHGKKTQYNLLVISKSPAAIKIIEYTKKVMSDRTTEDIERELKIENSGQTRLI